MSETDEIYIPPRVLVAVTGHIQKFQARKASGKLKAPQIFIMCGVPGNGKTTLTEEVCKPLGVRLHSISASTLSGEFEGQALTPLRCLYVTAAQDKTAWASAIRIDDFDLSVGRIDDRLSGTPHATMLNDFIMSLCDNPHRIEISHSNRQPEIHHLENPPVIFMTANDPSKIYQAVKRVGRATVFEWQPTRQEMLDSIACLYPACSLAELNEVIVAFPERPIAFFEQIGVRALDDALAEMNTQIEPGDVQHINYQKLAEQLLAVKKGLRAKDLIKAGTVLAAEDGGKSYLNDPVADHSGQATNPNNGAKHVELTA